jgi:Tfp pilus assembly protein PilP
MNAFISSFALLFVTTTVWAQPSPATPLQESSVASDMNFTIENSINLRDPFSRLINKSSQQIGETQIPELERHDLTQFKLVGIITGPKRNKALLMGPDSKMHVVTESTVVGTRHGQITVIKPGGVTVHEKVVNLLGQEEGVDTTIVFEEKKPVE